VVARDGCVGSDDFFVGAFGLWEGCSDRDVLSDWEAENGSRRRELESVAVQVSRWSLLGGSTDMATLCEMTVFSVSSKFWKTSGLSTFCTPTVPVSERLENMLLVACGGGADPTHAVDFISSQSQSQSNGERKPFSFHDQASQNHQTRRNVYAIDICFRQVRIGNRRRARHLDG
jgi:hypothetical protein